MLTVVSVVVRKLLRGSGLTKYLDRAATLLGIRNSNEYEQDVERFVRATIRPNDIAWDVGANRGHYTQMLSELVGRDGVVVAIEPESMNMSHLAVAAWPLPNVMLINAALSDEDGTLTLFLANDDTTGSTHALSNSGSDHRQSQSVIAFRGDTLVREGKAMQPRFLKIDVEGAEERVLNGLKETLQSPQLKAVLVEVHFGILDMAGDSYAQVRIEKFLRSCHLRVRWLDRSHIAAVR